MCVCVWGGGGVITTKIEKQSRLLQRRSTRDGSASTWEKAADVKVSKVSSVIDDIGE